ncbi:MAG TPA: F0F1 ATP synthase subunit A [Candidatus Acidoferrales bacterium]|nr:F0F1 ATP synthase subunit A [Candidatus Acidoferrales bacterium]
MHEQIGEHILWHWPFLGTIGRLLHSPFDLSEVHADTIMTTWLVMIVSLIFFAWVGNGYRSAYVNKRQTLLESVINYIADLARTTLGERGEPYVPFFIALFVFIFLLNQFGIFPFKVLGLPFGGSPTADLNTTVPLALIVFFLTWAVGFGRNGLKQFLHLAKPSPFLTPINIIEELARPATLAARLFFNIFVGELLFIIVASIVEAQVKIGSFDLSLAVTVVPFFIQFFNLFVGTVQAFVFTLLAIVYLSLALAEDH